MSAAAPPPADPPPGPPGPARPAGGIGGRSGPRPGGVLVALTVVVLAALGAPVLIAAVHAARGGGGSPAPASRATSPSVSSSGPSSGPSPSASTGSTASPPTARPAVTCWDGATARRVTACSRPSGAAGLSWVYPSIADQRCGRPTDAGPTGIVLRRVCRVSLGGGARALIVYAQWRSSADAVTSIRAAGLEPARGRTASGVRRFVSPGGKVAAAYVREPFSYVVTLPAGADPPATVGQVVRARPAGQVRGAPDR